MSAPEIKTYGFQDVEYAQELLLRNEVLRIPLGLKYSRKDLLQDQNDLHFGVFQNNEILGCLILSSTSPHVLKMRQVAVAPNRQKQGIGRLLIAAAHQYARENNFSTIFCHAREEAVPFYQRMHYKISGEKFLEIGIPHFRMEWNAAS